MIVLPSIAFGGFSGSAKDVTARQVNGRTILGVRSWPTGPVTNAQVVRRVALGKITKSYRSLTESQMRAWENLAAQTSGASVFGQKAQLSGVNLYVRLNVNRSMAGESLIVDAPESIENIANASYRLAVVSPSMVVFQGIKHQPSPLKLVVKMSAAVSPGISNGWSKTVIISPDTEDDWGEADLTTLYTKTIGITPEVGQKVFIEVYWMDSQTGFSGIENRDAVICMTDQEAAELLGGSRARYTKEDVEQRSEVSEFEIEYSTDGPAVNVDVISVLGTGMSYSRVWMNEPFKPEQLGKVYVVGRDLREGKYTFGLVEMEMTNNTEEGPYIKISNFAEGLQSSSELFGPGVFLPL